MPERAQEPEDGKMDGTAFVDVSPAASLKQCQSPEVVGGRKKTVESETRDPCRLPDSSGFFPDTQFWEKSEENRRPRRDRKLPLRFRQ